MASVSGRKARVTFEYEPEQVDELGLSVGDIIDDVVDEDDGWCKGSLNGKVGLFPNNFVEFLAEPEPEAPALVKAETSKDSLAGSKAKVLFDYEAENGDELSLKEGSIVEVLREVEDGWWEGMIHGRAGLFPSNFVELVKEVEGPPPLPGKESIPTEPAAPKPTYLDEEDTGNKRSSIIGQTKMMGGGMGFGNLINPDILSVTKLKKTDHKKRADPPQPKAPEPSPIKQVGSMKRKAPAVPPVVQTPAPAVPTKKAVERAKVIFEYLPENTDELALKIGDIVTVLNKNVYETDGWWEGELNGKQGLFPDNFVELLPEEEPPKELLPKPVRTKSISSTPVAGQRDKRPPPPTTTEEPKPTIEPPKKDMKKVAEPRKIPHLKMHDENEPLRPHLPPKKPVPPKPSSKPSVLPKKPVPKPPAKIILPKPQHKESDKHDLVKDKLNKTAPGMMEGLFKPIDSTNEGFNLDAVEKHEMLDHLTKNRAQLQTKRPPSTTRMSDGNLSDVNTRQEPEGGKVEKPIKIEPTEPAWKREARELREAKESKEKPVPPVPSAKEKHHTSENKTSPKTFRKPTEEPAKKSDSASADEVKTLRQEVSDLKALVQQMKSDMDAMKHKHEEDLKKMDKRVKKNIEQLTEDFDEQRNKYAKLEIDFDRLKKRRRRDSDNED